MKKRLFKWIVKFNWIYKLAKKITANSIVHNQNLLTPKYLTDRGWIEKDGYYIESDIKGRDLISIQFEHHYFRIYHSEKRTFIALKSKIEWFEMYYLLVADSTKMYELSGV